jgi:hypothetical protein
LDFLRDGYDAQEFFTGYQQQFWQAVKFCKEKRFLARPHIGPALSCSPCDQVQDLYSLGTPLAFSILLGGDADLLADLNTSHVTFVLLAGRHFISKNNDSMGHFHAAKNVIPALHKDPSALSRHRAWRVHYPALKHAFHGRCR